MSIEQTLAEINASLKTLVAIAQSGAQVAAAAAADGAAETKGTRGKGKAKDAAAADTTGTAVTQESNEKKDPAASAATTQQATATSAPSATAQAGTASASNSTGAPTWDDVVAGLQGLAKDPAHGPVAVKEIITKFGAATGATNVPGLQALGKNAEILAEVNARLNPAAAAPAGDDALFG
ncbi:hypothetical protein [Comamonas antarctica]|uniref:hypothetical protein n=1 Tax=Comamonas antarctica TaxID=2743470 RepID=UPI0028E5CF34|nr:hypothetical protein [Comamonas antarctica]